MTEPDECYICGKELPMDHNERVRGWFPEPHECHRECLSDLCAKEEAEDIERDRQAAVDTETMEPAG